VTSPFQKSVRACALLVLACAVVVLLGGWVLDIEVFKNLVPGAASMKPGTALGLGCAAASLLLLADPQASGWRLILGRICAVIPIVLGLAFLSEYAFGWNLRIDEFPFKDAVGRATGVDHPGRPSLTTVADLVLVGLALLTLNWETRWIWRPSEILIVPGAAVASISLVGYIYSIPQFYGPGSAAKMAIHTAICFVALSAGVLLARPHGRLLALFSSTSQGGRMTRRLMPFAVAVPLLLGWLRLKASEAGIFDDRVGTWWLTAATIAALILFIGRGAARIDAADEERRELEEKLQEMAWRDSMTGLFNRRHFEWELGRHARRVERHGGSSALIMLDLDQLKEVNDRFGHAAGDKLITTVATAIGARLRGVDVLGRLGGDEFCVLLLKPTAAGAAGVARELHEAVRAAGVGHDPPEAWSTVSIGVAFSADRLEDGGHALLEEADRAMYTAKRAGGDRVADTLDVPV
jgi:diguanylate cyclase (GGDEF)-like protein